MDIGREYDEGACWITKTGRETLLAVLAAANREPDVPAGSGVTTEPGGAPKLHTMTGPDVPAGDISV